MNAIDSYVLKKDHYEESTKSIFKSLWTDEEYKDVTLASNDQQEIRGHKAILGASSSFFKTIFKNNANTNLVLYLKGVSSQNLGSIVEFIYCGETNVKKSDLASFLDSSKELEIEGLMDSRTSAPGDPSDIFSEEGLLSSITDTEDEVKHGNETIVKMETKNDSILSESSGDILQIETLVKSHLSPLEASVKRTPPKIKPADAADVPADRIECEMEPRKYQCTQCDFFTAHRSSLSRHMALVHGPNSKAKLKDGKYSCNSCNFRTMHERSLIRHTETLHAGKIESGS